MRITKQARHEAKALFRACQVNGVLDEARVRQLVEKIVAARPRGYLGILSHFQRLVELDIERRRARVTTVTALPPELHSKLEADLTRRYGAGLQFEFQQDASLIGGMRVQVGSDVYDGSIRARLNQLQDNF
jgi:F-type H+-transporting ATPase subunit delta